MSCVRYNSIGTLQGRDIAVEPLGSRCISCTCGVFRVPEIKKRTGCGI